MKLTLSKKSIVDCLVSPVSKLTDNVLLTRDEQKIKTLAHSSDNTVIFQSSVEYKGDEFTNIIIPEVKTFLRLFSNIEEENITLEINENQIAYKSKQFSFKYHLLDEAYYSSKKSISEEKLNALTYDTEFDITKQKISELVKYSSIIPDAEKLYFFSRDNKVLAKIGDEQKANTNEIEIPISETLNRQNPSEISIPVSMQNIFLLTFQDNTPITVSVNEQLKIIRFKVGCLTYILSGLVK